MEQGTEWKGIAYMAVGPVGALTSVWNPGTETLVTTFMIMLLQIEEASFTATAVPTFNILLQIETEMPFKI